MYRLKEQFCGLLQNVRDGKIGSGQHRKDGLDSPGRGYQACVLKLHGLDSPHIFVVGLNSKKMFFLLFFCIFLLKNRLIFRLIFGTFSIDFSIDF